MTYTLTKCSKLGEHDPKYGTRYWGDALESALPVSFNSMDQTIGAGQQIEFETMAEKSSKKGTKYMQLYKVKVIGNIAGSQSEGVPAPQATNEGKSHPATPFTEADRDMLKDIHRMLKQLTLEDLE